MGAVACGPRVSVGDLGGGGGGVAGGDPLGGSPGVAGAVGGTGGDVIEGEGIAGGDAGSDAVGGRADPGYGSPCPVQAQGGADAGATRVDWTDPTAAPDCGAEPLSYQDYGSQAELEALMVGRWRRCKSRQLDGEDAGVEFTVDGHYYPLTFNAEHQIVRCIGVDYEGTWQYFPSGSTIPGFSKPSAVNEILLSGVYTNSPSFTNDPRQMRLLFFTPVPSAYVPLTE
jgi:hypothetical protein